MRGWRARGSRSRMQSRGVEAVHLRHQHVHEDQVVGQVSCRIHRFDAVRNDVGGLREPFQQQLRHALVHDVVLGQQDAHRRRERPLARRPGCTCRRACRAEALSTPTIASKSCDWCTGFVSTPEM